MTIIKVHGGGTSQQEEPVDHNKEEHHQEDFGHDMEPMIDAQRPKSGMKLDKIDELIDIHEEYMENPQNK